jgi:hypothetical protein
MKSQLLTFVLLVLVAVSCTKDNSVDATSYVKVPSNLFGTWTWLYSSGGYAGVTSTPATTGEIREIEFDTKNNFKYFVNGKLKTESKFQIEKSISIFSKDSALILLTKSWTVQQSIRFVHPDTLTLSEEVFDGFGHSYIRKN